jgi:hypothetical protein
MDSEAWPSMPGADVAAVVVWVSVAAAMETARRRLHSECSEGCSGSEAVDAATGTSVRPNSCRRLRPSTDSNACRLEGGTAARDVREAERRTGRLLARVSEGGGGGAATSPSAMAAVAGQWRSAAGAGWQRTHSGLVLVMSMQCSWKVWPQGRSAVHSLAEMWPQQAPHLTADGEVRVSYGGSDGGDVRGAAGASSWLR